MANLLVLFHSFYGNVFRLAECVADGARATGATVALKQVPENVPAEALKTSGAAEAKKSFEHVPTANVEELVQYDGIAFGTGTRFGNMSSTMRSFLDQTGKFWAEGQLIGKAATVFCATGTGGGRETTVISTWFTLAHHGMVIVPVGYAAPEIRSAEEVHGATPYGVTTVSKANAPRPNDIEQAVARKQGEMWAQVATRLAGQNRIGVDAAAE